MTARAVRSTTRTVKDFISFLAGAIFIEELLADDQAAPPPPSPAPDETVPPDTTSEPDRK